MIDQGSRQRRTLRHSARQVVRESVAETFEPHNFHEFIYLVPFFLEHAAGNQAGLDVPPHG